MRQNSLTAILAFFAAAFMMPASMKAEDKESIYRHVVLFQFKDSATAEQVANIEKEFAKLKDKIDTITGYEWGTNVSPEGLNDGLTHCFIVTFADKAGLEKYLPHPDHKAFVEKLLPILEKAVVVDFVPKD